MASRQLSLPGADRCTLTHKPPEVSIEIERSMFSKCTCPSGHVHPAHGAGPDNQSVGRSETAMCLQSLGAIRLFRARHLPVRRLTVTGIDQLQHFLRTEFFHLFDYGPLRWRCLVHHSHNRIADSFVLCRLLLRLDLIHIDALVRRRIGPEKKAQTLFEFAAQHSRSKNKQNASGLGSIPILWT